MTFPLPSTGANRRGDFQRIKQPGEVCHHGIEGEFTHLLRKSETALVVTQHAEFSGERANHRVALRAAWNAD